MPIGIQMALDYCSAPASTVDAEQAFSTGCQQINFMQHSMTSNTFRQRWHLDHGQMVPCFLGFNIFITFELKGNENPAATQPKVSGPDVSSSGEEFDWRNTDEFSNE
ncbi:hypothetical protein BDQ17DRAFT_1441701 [Cyathus striatus]|nr:hypothetical protein BDQ17DRAFT_1441701 [Cyathus striatus]